MRFARPGKVRTGIQNRPAGNENWSAHHAITLSKGPCTLAEMAATTKQLNARTARVATLESEDCRAVAGTASAVRSPTGASRDINTNFEASMKKRFLCGMLWGLASVLPAPSYAANSSGADVSPAPSKVLESALNHFRPSGKAASGKGNAASPGKLLDVNVDPYYSTASTIGSVTMTAVVPPYPSRDWDQFILVTYTVADSTQMEAALSAVLSYCGSKAYCAGGNSGTWQLSLESVPEQKNWPTVVARPGDTVYLNWTSEGSKWNLKASVQRKGTPVHRLVLVQSIDTSKTMRFVNAPSFYAKASNSANCDLLPARVSVSNIRIAAPGYDPQHWQTVPFPDLMECSLDLTMPSQSPGKIEISWKPNALPPSKSGDARH